MQGGGQGQHAFQRIVVRTAAADHGVNLVKAQLQLFYLCRNGQCVRAGVAHGKLLILGDLFALLRRGQDVSAAAVQMPSFFRLSISCAIFVTCATGTYSRAPAAVLATASVRPTA